MSSDTVPVTQAASFAEWLKRYVGMQDANKMRFSVAELKIAFETGRATPTPSHAMPSREEIARVIDPGGFSGEGDHTWEARQVRRNKALSKADAILALTSVDRASEADKLRPIETAPKDGSYFLFVGDNFDGGMAVVHWSDDLEWWMLDDGKNFEIPLRHEAGLTGWIPLPALSSIGSEAE